MALNANSSSLTVTASSSLPNGGGANAYEKQPAWKKKPLSNGHDVVVVVDDDDDQSSVIIGAHSWPALSDAARGGGCSSSSSESLKALAVDNPSSSSSPVVSTTYKATAGGTIPVSPQTQVTTNSNIISSSPNHNVPSRQRSMKRNANPTFTGVIPHPPPQQRSVVINNPSPRDHTQRQTHGVVGGGDHPAQQRPHYRNRNGNNNNNVGRREEGRNFNVRDARLPSQRPFSTFPRHLAPPPPSLPTPFISSQQPPQIRPFAGPIGLHDFQPPMYYVAAAPHVPFIPPIPHPIFYPTANSQLHSNILKQIDYYFSNDNLVKDLYLRQNMDDQGWVPIKLIAGFKQVTLLTNNIQLILDSLISSTVVEVHGEKVRSRHNWRTWINRTPKQFLNVSVTQQVNSVPDMLVAGVHNMSVSSNGWSQTDGMS
ncbi:hypothetical protein ACFE04_026415 [Oxalis oulophora]